jgi:uronate dehydrogenase
LAETLRISDIANLGGASANEESIYCNPSKENDVYDLIEACDGNVHFGGIMQELPIWAGSQNIIDRGLKLSQTT